MWLTVDLQLRSMCWFPRGKEVIEMTSTIRKAAVAAALASGLVIGGVGVTQAFAQSASPSASSSANSGGNSGSNASRSGNTDTCPHDNPSNSSTST